MNTRISKLENFPKYKEAPVHKPVFSLETAKETSNRNIVYLSSSEDGLIPKNEKTKNSSSELFQSDGSHTDENPKNEKSDVSQITKTINSENQVNNESVIKSELNSRDLFAIDISNDETHQLNESHESK
ncbi:hypothetical protein TRFO_39549 [Tritrichomonas foetus]|uniref:Uncharacterized protein n=1 Tax=Tritrichomonas foetus TaxID=1144522 RepID=A0A1J4J6G8_9EUKA|nr:hypothetical protein TRFO_39549 [Tritrichomonas foetus]|eukprot:OHS94257.1 hypothetical protein TRFO_39549 [Tritrichomonas foetus]